MTGATTPISVTPAVKYLVNAMQQELDRLYGLNEQIELHQRMLKQRRAEAEQAQDLIDSIADQLGNRDIADALLARLKNGEL